MMGLTEYQRLAARTINPDLTLDETINHALFGLAAEVGEVTGLFQKEMQGHPLLNDSLRKEIGDVLWMLGELCTAFDFDMEDIARENIEKLKRRYPAGFSTERSLHRKD